MSSDAGDGLAEADAFLLGRGRAIDLVRGAALYFKAAAAGNLDAMLRSAVFLAEGLGQPQDWKQAIGLAARAAAAGNADAQRQLLLLADRDQASDWLALARGIEWDALLTPPPLTRLSEQAQLGVARGFAPLRFARWLIERAEDGLERSTVHDLETGELTYDAHRTGLMSTFGVLKRDLICAVLEERAARLSRAPVTHHEPMSAIRYDTGQHYGHHFDFVPPRLLDSDPVQAAMGQRTTTVVTYLNEGFEGAATEFPRLGLRLKPDAGDALLWSNVLPGGEPDQNTLHAGLPPTSGQKWVLSQWIRNRAQPFR